VEIYVAAVEVLRKKERPDETQGSRVTIVVVQVGALKLYVAAVEVLRKKERQG
jgi:hypothetical protein